MYILRSRAIFPFHLRPSPDFILLLPNAAIYSLYKTPPSLGFQHHAAALLPRKQKPEQNHLTSQKSRLRRAS